MTAPETNVKRCDAEWLVSNNLIIFNNLITQFPTSNDKKYSYVLKTIDKLKYFIIYHQILYLFQYDFDFFDMPDTSYIYTNLALYFEC